MKIAVLDYTEAWALGLVD